MEIRTFIFFTRFLIYEMKILMLIAQKDFRDEEYLVPKELFKKRGWDVITASIERKTCTGMLGARVNPDITVEDALKNFEEYDALVISGGIGSPSLANNKNVIELIRKFNESKKVIGAICLAPTVLAKAGILNGRRATVFKNDFSVSVFKENGVELIDGDVIVDDNIITGNGPSSARKFGERIIEILEER